jgi:hypothetical protein
MSKMATKKPVKRRPSPLNLSIGFYIKISENQPKSHGQSNAYSKKNAPSAEIGMNCFFRLIHERPKIQFEHDKPGVDLHLGWKTFLCKTQTGILLSPAQ